MSIELIHNCPIIAIGGGSVASSGGITTAVTTKIANYTASSSDAVILCDATSGAITITLPTAIGISGAMYIIKKIDSSTNIVTLTTTLSQNIDGVTSHDLATQYTSVNVVSDGNNWWVE